MCFFIFSNNEYKEDGPDVERFGWAITSLEGNHVLTGPYAEENFLVGEDAERDIKASKCHAYFHTLNLPLSIIDSLEYSTLFPTSVTVDH